MTAAAAAVALFGLALASMLTEASQTAAPPWWPAAGVAVGAVAVAARRRRPLAVAAVAIAVFAAALVADRPLVAAASIAVASAAEAAVAGWWLGSRGPPELLTLRDLGRLLAAAGGGAVLAGGVVAAGTAQLPGGDPWNAWLAVTTSHLAAVIVLAPQVMRLPARVTAGRGEAAVLSAVVVGTTLVVFAPGQQLPLVFLPGAVLVWTGLRVSVRTSSVLLVAVGTLAVLLTAHQAGPFVGASALAGPAAPIALVHTFLVACALVAFGFALSVAQRDAALGALADRCRFDQATIEAVDAGVLACDADGHVVLHNTAFRRVVGVGDDDPVDKSALADRVRLSEEGAATQAGWTPLYRALAGEEITAAAMQVGPPDGPRSEVVVMARRIHSADGRLLGAVSAFTDVTEDRALQARLRESVAFHDAILAVIPDDIYLLDLTTLETLWASRPLARRLGYSPDEVKDREILDALVHPDDAVLMHAAYAAAADLADGEVQSLRMRVRTRDGQYRWLSRRVTPFARAADGRVRQVIGVRHAASLVESEQLLAEAALHDSLTGLPNRRLLGDRLQAALTNGGSRKPVAVLFCDLDEFKRVNDTGGHAAGDALLRATAQRLRAALRPEDTVARVGGDEFVVVLAPGGPDIDDDLAQAREAAATVARRITRSLARPIEVAGHTYGVTVSIGVTFARPGDSAEQALRAADTAMYQAKTRGKNRFQLFEPDR